MKRLPTKRLAIGMPWSLGLGLWVATLSLSGAQEPAPPVVSPFKVEPIKGTPAVAPDELPPAEGEPAPPADGTPQPDPAAPPLIEPIIPANPDAPPETPLPETSPASAVELAEQLHQADLEKQLAEDGTGDEANRDEPAGDDGVSENPLVSEELALGGAFEATRMFPARPTGFDEGIPSSHRSLKANRHYGLAADLSVLYDSNIRRTAATSGDGSKDDVIMSFSPEVLLHTLGDHWVAEASLSLNYKAYLENDDLNKLDYEIGGRIAYLGSKLTANVAIDVSRTSGGNRYSGGYLEQTNYNWTLAATYRFSSKTSADFDLRFHQAEAQGGTGSDVKSVDFKTVGLWSFSPLLQIGPGVRYKLDSGSEREDRDSIGPLLRARYKATQKIALNADFGMDFYNQGGSGSTFHTAIEADYRLDEFWRLKLSVLKDSAADESTTGGYRETFGIKAGVERRILRSTLDFSAGYESNKREADDGAEIAGGDTDSVVLDSLLSIPLFNDQAKAGFLLRWRDQSGSGPFSWSSTQVGVQISADY